jgi:hypothetical protein
MENMKFIECIGKDAFGDDKKCLINLFYIQNIEVYKSEEKDEMYSLEFITAIPGEDNITFYYQNFEDLMVNYNKLLRII